MTKADLDALPVCPACEAGNHDACADMTCPLNDFPVCGCMGCGDDDPLDAVDGFADLDDDEPDE